MTKRDDIHQIIQEAKDKQLPELDLFDKQLTELPSAIGQLSQLKTLNLFGNQLTELPSAIGQLSQLKTLNLFGNQLTELPSAIGQLSQLKTLNLSNNRLRDLPSELCQLSQLTDLSLSDNQLRDLPSEISQLPQLTSIDLYENLLTELPAEFFQLFQLRTLVLSGNQLTELPVEFFQLSQLTDLYLAKNQLTELPSEFGQLSQLRTLFLYLNQLRDLPSEIGQLSQLMDLRLWSNQLRDLPSEIGQLSQLRILELNQNKLTDLPREIGQLSQLTILNLAKNPLDETLQKVASHGVDDLRAYLQSLADAEALYEAKLLLVGEGKVGKSCLLAALRGEDFLEDRPTTHGIEIRRLDLPHPDVETNLRLNAWDFGGQQVYRVTHQFFYSRRSLYLLLWEPRLGPEQCDVRGWIERIRLRVGDDARILIIATHCESSERVARIDKAELRRDHGDVIVGFHEIDSKTGAGIEDLKLAIAQAASELPQMGDRLSQRWRDARDEIQALENPRIDYRIFAEICTKHRLKPNETSTLGDLLHDLGDIIFFGDDEGLRDAVVLQPEWLTRAIGFVLEDSKTNHEDGVLEHTRLRGIWYDHDIEKRERYEPAFHPYFLRLMEKYDVSYRLEGEPQSLVAQLVPDVRPDLPWSTDEPPAIEPGKNQISLVCELSDEPPGLVPWMIVRTHRFASRPRRHWQRGTFLDYGEHGTALFELRRREFHITVRADWPDYFMSILRFTLEALIQKRWPGLETRFSVPCPEVGEDGRRCRGRFPLKALYTYKGKGLEQLPCTSECLNLLNIDQLLTGFKPTETRAQLGRIEEQLTGMASALAARHMILMRALSSENRECPRLFTLLPEEIEGWNLAKIGKIRLRLTLWCEYPDGQHPTCPIGSGGDGEYTFETSKEWLQKIAPYASTIARTLKTLLPIAGAAAKVVLDETLFKEVGLKLQLMEKLTSTLLKDDFDAPDSRDETDELVTRAEGAGLRELHTLLLDLDPERKWGNLKRVLTPAGDYLWLCPTHHREFEPGLPKLD